MVSLSATPDVRAPWRDTARQLATGIAWILYAAGWLVSRTLRLIGTAVAGVFMALGWTAGRLVWPAIRFCAAATRAGWDAGRKAGAA